jgi:regulatory protein
MIITAVERKPKRRGRVDVYVDGVPAFDVSRATARTHALRPGRPLDDSAIAAIVADDRRHSALAAAVALLARRPRSEREVRQRLRQHRFDDDVAAATVERLRALHLLDDAEFARTWADARDATSPRSGRLIVQELRARGVDAGLARDAVAGVSDTEAAYRLAVRRMRALAATDDATFRARLTGLLQRRGFAWSVVVATVERCLDEAGRSASHHDDDPVAEVE